MAMTGPVVEKPGGDGWTMTFFLSNDLETAAPRPNDDDIELVSEPERLIAALRYRGNNTEEARAEFRPWENS